jgi:hypothetical protein
MCVGADHIGCHAPLHQRRVAYFDATHRYFGAALPMTTCCIFFWLVVPHLGAAT